MSQTRKTCYLGFEPADYKAAQLWLEEMAAAGWALERIRPGRFPRARFCPCTPGTLHYCVDIRDHGMKMEVLK